MKKYFFFAAAALALASCSSDDFVGTGNTGNNEVDNAAISFNSGTNKVTRADQKTGAEAATILNNNFVVYGYKTTGTEKSTVYDHYNVNYIANSAGQTESNEAGWEYVGQTANTLNSVSGTEQTIKYWDYSASQYDFVAFSFGNATQGTGDDNVEASKVTTDHGPMYTLKGTVDDLAKCYISDRVSAKPNLTNDDKVPNKLVGYQDPVSFNFRSLKTQVKLAIYEIVPGYSIKDVKFYKDATETTPSATVPTLFAEDATIPSGKGTMTITFGSNEKNATDFNQAKVSWSVDEAATNSKTVEFGELSTVDKEAKEKKGTKFIGRDVTNASKPTDYKTVLSGTTVGKLTLKVDYTLESIDGSGEEINVTGATATIPDKYTQWKPNYAYTYIFKISDKTNGGTGGSTAPKGLYPITFDAVVTETETGKQETITEVDEPSITTYAKGAVNNEYKANSNIYVSVGNNLPLYLVDTPSAGEGTTATHKNIALYVVDDTKTAGYTITEANVALALKNGTHTDDTWTPTEGSKKLTVKEATGLTNVSEIDAADAVDGNKITGNFAKFKPTAAGTYAVEYIDKAGTANPMKYYKVIIVK